MTPVILPSDRPASQALFVINDLNMGGAERVLLGYVNNLRRVRPTVVVLRPALDLVGELDPAIALATLSGSLPAERAGRGSLGATRRGQPPGRMLLETPVLARMVLRLVLTARRKRCRVVSTFLNRAHAIALMAKALDPTLRVVINIHEMLSEHLALEFGPREREAMHIFIRRAFPRADAIVAACTGARDDLVKNFGIARERIAVVHNPVDIPRIRMAGARDPDADVSDRPLIVAVGRLIHRKGFDVLIRAVAKLNGARLLIVGEGEVRRDLERLIRELGVGDRVELAGARDNPWPAMSRAQLVAVPSRSEAFPNVIGEAMALSRPVVAARCSPGVAQYLEDGRCGVLVPPDDVDALAAALARLLCDAELRGRLVAEGDRRVATLDLVETVRRYEDVIARVDNAAA